MSYDKGIVNSRKSYYNAGVVNITEIFLIGIGFPWMRLLLRSARDFYAENRYKQL